MSSPHPSLPSRRPGSQVGRGAVSSSGGCQSCGARVRPDQPWCTLCHAPLGVSQPPVTSIVPAEAVRADAARADAVLAEAVRADAVPADPGATEAVAAALLAELATSEARAPVPAALAGVMQWADSGPLARAVLGVVVGLGVVAACMGLLGLLGLFV